MNNYKELSFLISSLFVIYFFKDIITTLLILAILSSISLLLMQTDNENDKSNIKIENEKPNYAQNTQTKPPVLAKPPMSPKLESNLKSTTK